MAHRPLIALADPQWIGHRETYFREFVLSLLRVGVDVVALCPHPERLMAQVASAVTEDGPQVYATKLEEPARLSLVGSLPHDPLTTFRRWRRTASGIRKMEQKLQRRVDLLFLPWLDSYLRASLSRHLALAGLRCPWSGLYFRPYHLVKGLNSTSSRRYPAGLNRVAKGDGLLRSPSCIGVSVLDETLAPVLEKSSRKPVVLFPDITDESEPNLDEPFARQVRDEAHGRKVIGLIGLERRKGVITMLKAAELALAEKKPWLFVLSGVVKLAEYPEEERRYFEEQMAKSRLKDGTSNLLFQDELKPIPDGPAFNGVMASFDVLYTAYHDFEGSSNVLTKAAILHKPVVSTGYGCIGSRTKTYQLGLAIPQGDAAQCCQAIEKVLEGKTWSGEVLAPRHAEYHAKHNRKRLDLAMIELLNLLPIAAQAVHEGMLNLF